MDGLLAEINRKKADLGVVNANANGNGDAGPSTTKYMKRAEVEAAQEEAKRLKREQAKETLRKEKEAREAKKQGVKRTVSQTCDAVLSPLTMQAAPAASSAQGTPEPSGAKISTSAPPVLPPAETSRRLRSRGQPIRYFGETDKDRSARLRALELADGDGRRTGGRVDEFRSMLRGVEEEMLLKDSERAGKRRKVEEAASASPAPEAEGDKVQGYTGLIDLGLLKTDISKLHPQVYWYWKVCLFLP